MSAEEIEQQLGIQLEEQQDALAAVEQALHEDPAAEGLEEVNTIHMLACWSHVSIALSFVQMRDALQQGIADLTKSLLDLKKSR
eukprot:scaffold271650_cov52-Prasinocladus_malaysianus.AAC.1